MTRPKHSVDTAVWNEFVARHASGGVIDGVVVSVVPFGAFVDVGDGIHGLLHESSWDRRPEPGSLVAVRILALDVENRRMSLTPA
jgi:ribosomal protein S1